jgi:hypothetical protein
MCENCVFMLVLCRDFCLFTHNLYSDSTMILTTIPAKLSLSTDARLQMCGNLLIFLTFVLTLADELCYTWFVHPISCWCFDNSVPGGISGPPCSWGYKFGGLALQVGRFSRIGAIKYCLESRGTQTRALLRWRGPAATVNYRPVLSSERALQNNKPATVCWKFQGERRIGRGSNWASSIWRRRQNPVSETLDVSNKNRTMDIKEHNNCINIPWSQTCRP